MASSPAYQIVSYNDKKASVNERQPVLAQRSRYLTHIIVSTKMLEPLLL